MCKVLEDPSDIDCLRCGQEGCNERKPMRNSSEGIYAAVILMVRISEEAHRRAAIADCMDCTFKREEGCIICGESRFRPCLMRIGKEVQVKIISG